MANPLVGCTRKIAPAATISYEHRSAKVSPAEFRLTSLLLCAIAARCPRPRRLRARASHAALTRAQPGRCEISSPLRQHDGHHIAHRRARCKRQSPTDNRHRRVRWSRCARRSEDHLPEQRRQRRRGNRNQLQRPVLAHHDHIRRAPATVIALQPRTTRYFIPAPTPRNARPGFAPVCTPSRNTSTPFTNTSRIPTDS